MSSIATLPSQSTGDRPIASAGQPATSQYEARTLVNSNPQAKQVTTSTISAVNDATYTITIGGVTVSYTADGTATQQEINDGLKAAFEANAEIGAYAVFAQTAASTYTLTGIRPGEAFTVTVDANQSLAATTAAASADPIPFGRFVTRTGFDADTNTELCALPKASDYTAQVDTWTLTYEAGIVTRLEVEWNGTTYAASTAMATDADTTAAALAALINAQLPANSVLAAGVGGASGQMTLTAEVAGDSFTSSIGLTDPTTGAASLSSNKSASTDLLGSLRGVAQVAMNQEQSTAGVGQYAANANCSVQYDGRIFVEFDGAPTFGAQLYLDVGTSTPGAIETANAADNIPLPASIVEFVHDAPDGVNLICIDLRNVGA